jgi:nicotinate-nucleotide pyrophosphorylase (carboxylating)
LSIWLQPEPSNWWNIVQEAYVEDIGSGDITSYCIPEDREVEWYIEVQGNGVLSGVGIVQHLLTAYSNERDNGYAQVFFADGQEVTRGDIIIEGKATARQIATIERVALNFLMHLSGVATLTNQYVTRVEGTGAKIIDTRKTIPGLRTLQKYAVRCGGGHNHRMGLYDAAMIKDNHIQACGSITAAIEKLRSYASHMIKIEVECETMEMVDEAVAAKADIVLLDNMDPFLMREIVGKYKGKVILEASGGISLETVRGVAQTGVDYISVGAITHSAPSLPIHLEFRS